MKDNNGKLAIAIVAMFVVALSIVGFTYAYFTASVGHNTQQTSVEVTAGELVINYTSGNEILAQNIVPGWKTDGKSYYDPVYSVTQREIDGVMTNTYAAVSTDTYPTKSDEAKSTPTSADGIANNATFSVENTGTDDAAYSVTLNVTENGLDATDSATNFSYVLTENGTEIATGYFKGGAETITLIADRTIVADADANEYVLSLDYANNGDQSLSVGAKFAATIVVTGLGQSATTTTATAGE